MNQLPAVDMDAVRFNDQGLVPAVVQHAVAGTVLMVGYLSEESLARTQETGDLWFWSRSRQELWHKGETSGHYLRLVELRLDCDGDVVLARVLPEGPTCHTGEPSCFFRRIPTPNSHPLPEPSDVRVLASLFATIEERKRQPEPGSYTNHLLTQGVDRIGRKIGEEAAEVIIAAKNGSAPELQAEVADLFYHCLVLLAEQNVTLDDVCALLAARQNAPRRHQGAVVP